MKKYLLTMEDDFGDYKNSKCYSNHVLNNILMTIFLSVIKRHHFQIVLLLCLCSIRNSFGRLVILTPNDCYFEDFLFSFLLLTLLCDAFLWLLTTNIILCIKMMLAIKYKLFKRTKTTLEHIIIRTTIILK